MAVIEAGEVTGLVMSCRVLGLGVENTFLQHVVAEHAGDLTARIIETSRNARVRNIYRDNGFISLGDGLWRLDREAKRRIA